MSDKQINDGGPAFPHVIAAVHGMTLRDYFAAKALQGILASPIDFGDAETQKGRVSKAYEYADSMLAERQKGGG